MAASTLETGSEANNTAKASISPRQVGVMTAFGAKEIFKTGLLRPMIHPAKKIDRASQSNDLVL